MRGSGVEDEVGMMPKRADRPDGYYGDGATLWDFRQQGRDTELERDGEDDVYLLLTKYYPPKALILLER